MNLQENLDRFKDYLLIQDCSTLTITNYIITVKQFFHYIKKKPKEITQEDINNYKVHLKHNYAHSSLTTKLAAIKQLIKYLKKDIEIKIPHCSTKNPDVLSIEEIQKIFETTRNARDTAILKTLYYTGLRQAELRNLKINDIDWEKQKIKVNNGKGNTYDIINIHQEALQSIKIYLDYIRPIPKKGHEKTLFLSRNRQRLSAMTLLGIVKNTAAQAGITKRVYPHIFRASLITHMDENGASVFEIKAQSRHRDVSNLQRYVRHSDSHIRDIYNKTVPTFNNSQNKPTINPESQSISSNNLFNDLENRYKNREITFEQLLQIGQIIKDDKQLIAYQ